MNERRAFFWIFALFLVQNAVHSVFLASTPPFLLAGVLYYALKGGPSRGLAVGMWAGLLLEFFSAGPIGWQMITLGAAGLFAGSMATTVFPEGPATQLLLPPICNYLVAVMNRLVFGGPEAFGPGALIEAFSFSQLFLSAAVAPPVFAFLKRVGRPRAPRAAVWR